MAERNIKKGTMFFVNVISAVCILLVLPAFSYAAIRVVVFGLDETGSYSFRQKAINMAKSLIEELRPGDIFYFRRITDKSYQDSCSVFKLEIPLVGEEPKNRFDSRARTAWLKSVRQAEEVKGMAKEVLSSLTVLKAPRTDIWGFFAASADRFQLVKGDNAVKLVILASDMKDNCGLKSVFDLCGSEVHVVGFETGKDPVLAHKMRSQWVNALSRCKAASVRFYPIDERISLNR